jgi:L-alanine-DL-glutamate epimerase-like enolase superfamily enzyme
MIESISARPLEIAFKTTFSHASATRAATHSLWVEARLRDGAVGYGEGCPRDYVTGETLTGALDFVSLHSAEWIEQINDLDALTTWIRANRSQIDGNPAAWCAVELALLDAYARSAGKTVESLLGLPAITGEFRYSAVLGDAGANRFQEELSRYQQAHFRDFKIKLSGDLQRDRAKVDALKAAGIAPASVRADANNLWPDAREAIRFLGELAYGFSAIEEPLHARDHAGMDELAQATGCSIILDESLLRADQLAFFSRAPMRWILNLRISKMGGLVRSLEVLERSRRLGLRVIIGAHVGETSLLTRAALTAANAGKAILVAQEGAFGTHLLAHDVVASPIMFGAGGMLKAGQLPAGPGFGLDPVV